MKLPGLVAVVSLLAGSVFVLADEPNNPVGNVPANTWVPWRKGRPVSDKVLEALAKGRKRVNSPAARRKHSATNKQRGIRPPVGRLWTQEEDALLGVLRDSEVVKRTGRTLNAVRWRRCQLGMKRQGWSRRNGAEAT